MKSIFNSWLYTDQLWLSIYADCYSGGVILKATLYIASEEWNDDWWACAVHSRVVFQVRIKYTLRWKPVLELLPPAWFLTPAGPFTGIFCDSLLGHYKNIEIEYSSGSFKQTFVTKGGGNFKEMSQVTKIVLNSGSQLLEL